MAFSVVIRATCSRSNTASPCSISLPLVPFYLHSTVVPLHPIQSEVNLKRSDRLSLEVASAFFCYWVIQRNHHSLPDNVVDTLKSPCREHPFPSWVYPEESRRPSNNPSHHHLSPLWKSLKRINCSLVPHEATMFLLVCSSPCERNLRSYPNHKMHKHHTCPCPQVRCVVTPLAAVTFNKVGIILTRMGCSTFPL
jgi:hypothetical protein